jgi:hypothetical protein
MLIAALEVLVVLIKEDEEFCSKQSNIRKACF